MRDILFKAKPEDWKTDKSQNYWIEGYILSIPQIGSFICTGKITLKGLAAGVYAPEMYPIDPETLCQYIGEKDMKGNKIWENDIVEMTYEEEAKYLIAWDREEQDFKGIGAEINEFGELEETFMYIGCCTDIKVIGNKFDNPELLKGLDVDYKIGG